MIIPQACENNPSLRGTFASKHVSFGEFNRYALVAVHTRFAHVQWFVFDAEHPDPMGMPAVIRQEDSPVKAIGSLVEL